MEIPIEEIDFQPGLLFHKNCREGFPPPRFYKIFDVWKCGYCEKQLDKKANFLVEMWIFKR